MTVHRGQSIANSIAQIEWDAQSAYLLIARHRVPVRSLLETQEGSIPQFLVNGLSERGFTIDQDNIWHLAKGHLQYAIARLVSLEPKETDVAASVYQDHIEQIVTDLADAPASTMMVHVSLVDENDRGETYFDWLQDMMKTRVQQTCLPAKGFLHEFQNGGREMTLHPLRVTHFTRPVRIISIPE